MIKEANDHPLHASRVLPKQSRPFRPHVFIQGDKAGSAVSDVLPKENKTYLNHESGNNITLTCQKTSQLIINLSKNKSTHH